MAFGLTTEGFNQKTLEDILEEIEDDEKAIISPSINTLPTSVVGQLNGVVGDRIAELWEVALAVYRGSYPDSASGEALDNVAAITGATRLPAEKSTVSLTVNLNAGVTLPLGNVASQVTTGARFVTTETVTNGGGSPADIAVEAESEDYGPIAGASGTITVIETPVSGWNTVTNALDAVAGQDIETDSDFRVRREALLRATGAATVEAIRSDLLDVDDVDEVFVLENVTNVTDVDGIPPKAFESIILGGDDQELADQIWASKPAGIEGHGSTSETVTDSQGIDHTIKFTRPTEIDIYIDITVATNTNPAEGPIYPVDGDDQIKAAIVAAGNQLGIGDDAILEYLKQFAFDVDGVTDITAFTMGIVPSPVGTSNISIDIREIARFDTSRVDVTS